MRLKPLCNFKHTVWKLACLALAVSMAPAFGAESPGKAGELRIWDSRPAAKWDVAYPVGNGRLGAMPFGGYPEEKILLNEETIWQKGGGFGVPENSFATLEEMRKLEQAGDYNAVDRLFESKI